MTLEICNCDKLLAKVVIWQETYSCFLDVGSYVLDHDERAKWQRTVDIFEVRLSARPVVEDGDEKLRYLQIINSSTGHAKGARSLQNSSESGRLLRLTWYEDINSFDQQIRIHKNGKSKKAAAHCFTAVNPPSWAR